MLAFPLAGCGDSVGRRDPSPTREPIPRRSRNWANTMSKNMQEPESATTKAAEEEADRQESTPTRSPRTTRLPTRRSDHSVAVRAGRAWPRYLPMSRRSLGLSLEAGEEFDQVAELGLGQLGAPGRRAWPKGRACAPRSSPWARRATLPSAVIRRTSLSSSPRRTPVWTLPSLVASTTDSNPCAICLLGFDDRFQQVGSGSPGADAGELGADLAPGWFAAGLLDLVAANALDRGLGREDGHPALGDRRRRALRDKVPAGSSRAWTIRTA